ncbi:hypothetical protein caldi_13590 [Caldinitratiruptor microaerophilus]|uniref:Uncharacterized protein n=1 Tax=Caldinitratiruptor microaerophilus TaxID=671077 RepID=A0AA35CJ71_9FIRM|nr:hypothetical protein caldi_13590 [Caldinitratiruptor microaerophilus]
MYGAAFSAFVAWWLSLDEVRSIFAGALLLGLFVPAVFSLWDWGT